MGENKLTTTTFRGADDNRLVGDWRGPTRGPGVLFLHGGGQTRHSWGGSAESLADRGFRTLTLDHRGHGESDWITGGDYRLNRFAEDARIVAREFASPPAVVGASLGGLTSMLLEGNLAPGTFSSVVLVDIIPEMDRQGVDRIKAFMFDRLEAGFASLEEAAEAVAAYSPHRTRTVDPDGLRKNLRQGDDGRWRWHWDPAFLKPAFDGDGSTDDEPASDFYHPVLLHQAVADIAVPMQLVRGKLSDIVSESGAQAFLARFPKVEFVDVSDASHMVAGDKNDVFTDAVANFLERVTG